MIAALLCLIVSQVAPGDGLRRAIEALQTGDARAAWIAAESETDATQRSQAKVYVRLQAGDLDGALDEARRGSLEHPDDPWLAERAAAIAITLKRVAAADEALARLEAAASRSRESERTRWREAIHSTKVAVEVLHDNDRDRAGADSRARGVSLGIIALCVAALLFLARRA